MESETIQIGNFSVRIVSMNTLIIGSGAASLNAAVSLRSMGQENIMIVTSGFGSGTSNNAGSDKQTYYKLSLSGSEPDSARLMAQDLFDGRCMHGDIALCEAQGSVKAFMRLVEFGVPFPHDRFGSWAGYKTDHDPHSRATSAGPWTSRMMFRVLSEEVKRLRIKIIDHHQVITLLTAKDGSKVIGALAINTREKAIAKSFVLFNAINIVMGTGGPGDMYESTVYPASQTGSTGMAFRAGARGQNLTESQFGIASLKFRWNLSGSYQQVIPRYISTDIKGNEPIEFLNEYFPGYKSLSGAIFRKGYQWPFDPAKINGFGSSLIDMLVYREKKEKGRRVFIDYTRNISWEGDDSFSPLKLDGSAREYLASSGSLQGTPVERLIAMNKPAYELYREHGIDLETNPVEIGICVQHNNGGLKGNIWWESDLKHLFPVGEVNGSHGVYRPGGSALNSGQVGSYRAALFISRRYNGPPPETAGFLGDALKDTESLLSLATSLLSKNETGRNGEILAGIRKRMSDNAGIVRNGSNVARAVKEAYSMLENFRETGSASSVKELAEYFRIYDNCLTHLVYLEAIKTYIEKGGRSRGSFLVSEEEQFKISDIIIHGKDINLCGYDRQVEKDILEVSFKTGKFSADLVKTRDIPEQDLWFEKVWKDYLEDNFVDD